MDRGLIEVFACNAAGKTHESALILEGEPYQVQVGLLLLGLEPAPDAREKSGSPVRLWVEWGDESARRRVRARSSSSHASPAPRCPHRTDASHRVAVRGIR